MYYRPLNMAVLRSIVFVALFFGLFTATSHAQVIPGMGNVSLVISPQSPAPHSVVTVSLNDYSVNSVGMTIFWYVNDVERAQERNERSIRVQAGEVGAKTDIKVTLVRNGVVAYTATQSFTTSVIDVVAEAYTYVPIFYKGRALPSTNAPVRFVAIVNDGAQNTTSYSYKWTYKDAVLFGGAVKGKQSVVIETPRFGDEYLSLEVYNAQGALIGTKNTLIHAVEPELHFYEWSPLRGLLGKEIAMPFELFGEETTLYAEPYYLNATVNSQAADFAWKINGASAPGNTEVPNAITLMRSGEQGKSYIDFSATTKETMPQLVRYGFEVFFE